MRGAAIFHLQDQVERLEPPLPIPLLTFDPGARQPERASIDADEMLAPLATPAYQSGPFQNTDVLGDGVERHLERRGEIRHPHLSRREALQDRAARGIGQRNPHPIGRRDARFDIHPIG